MKIVLLLAIFLPFVSAQGQQKFAVLLSERVTALEIQKQFFKKDSTSFIDVPLPQLVSSDTPTRLYFYGIVSSKQIDYTNYLAAFGGVTSTEDMKERTLTHQLTDSFLSYKGVALFENDSLKIDVVETIYNNFARNRFDSVFRSDQRLLRLKVDSIHVNLNNQPIDAKVAGAFYNKRLGLMTPAFSAGSITALSDSVNFYLRALSQDGAAIFIDTAFVAANLIPATRYQDLVIENPVFSYAQNVVKLNCLVSGTAPFKVPGQYNFYQLQNKYLASIYLDPCRLTLKNVIATVANGANQNENAIIQYLLPKWVQANKGKTFVHGSNVLSNTPLLLSGKVFHLTVNIPYVFYENGNLILLSTVFY